jgi:hypothetical protein
MNFANFHGQIGSAVCEQRVLRTPGITLELGSEINRGGALGTM